MKKKVKYRKRRWWKKWKESKGEAQRKEAEKKRRKKRTAERDKQGMKLLEKWLRASKEKAGGHEDASSTEQRSVGQSVKQHWDCSQIENEEEEEEEGWQKKRNPDGIAVGGR